MNQNSSYQEHSTIQHQQPKRPLAVMIIAVLIMIFGIWTINTSLGFLWLFTKSTNDLNQVVLYLLILVVLILGILLILSAIGLLMLKRWGLLLLTIIVIFNVLYEIISIILESINLDWIIIIEYIFWTFILIYLWKNRQKFA